MALPPRKRPAQEQPAAYLELFLTRLEMLLGKEHGTLARGYPRGQRRGTGETAVEVYRSARWRR